MTKPNTIGLGEYEDRDLLAALQQRGVLDAIIGETDTAFNTYGPMATYSDHERLVTFEKLRKMQRETVAILLR